MVPSLVFFFPLLNWMRPHTVYKVTDMDQLEQLKMAQGTTKVGFGIAMFTGGLSILIANLLKPYINNSVHDVYRI